MLWAYMSFSQFLIIWSGNLTEEIPWYLRRSRGGWQWVALALIVFHFFLPFFVLLFREAKRQPAEPGADRWADPGDALVDLAWLVLPAFPASNAPGVLGRRAGAGRDRRALAGGRSPGSEGRPLVPLHDPILAEVLEHHGEVTARA